jgi:hypothetical protein
MKVFLGWSGGRSYEVAKAFEEWLPKVIQAIDPFISSEIPKGKRWGAVIADELEDTKVGIICVTKENLNENWILFEAGALSKTKDAYVCTFLLDLKSTDIEEPLASFQHTTFEKEDIRKLMDTINETVEKSRERSLREDLLNSTFDKFWSGIEAKLKDIVAKPSEVVLPSRDPQDMIEEILEIARRLDRWQEQYDRQMMELPAGPRSAVELAVEHAVRGYRTAMSQAMSQRMNKIPLKYKSLETLSRKEDDTDNNEYSE